MAHNPDMSNKDHDLRHLARQIVDLARAHRCWTQAHPYVLNLQDTLCAVGAVEERNREIAELQQKVEQLQKQLDDK